MAPMHENAKLFSLVDYGVFGAMLMVSTAIGAHQAFLDWRRKRNRGKGCEVKEDEDANEFLTGGGQLGTVPVALSMLASFLSSITLIGQPAEVYLYGAQMWMFGPAFLLCIPVVNYIFIPFFHSQRDSASAYQYFGKRFGPRLQLLSSILFTLQMVLYLALVIYAPALALYQVTGINTELIVTIMYIVVIFYTTIGGIKAVVWTDCFQVVVLYFSMFAVLLKGTIDLGGFSNVFARSSQSYQTSQHWINWSMDPTERYTFWSCLFGAGFLHTSIYSANQLQVQRYMTVPSPVQARKMIWLNLLGWILVVAFTVYAGLLIRAYYYNCDPLLAGIVEKPDQLFPLYVMETLGEYSGFPGLFVAGIFSAGLSTVSTGLNSLAAIWETELARLQINMNRGLLVKVLALGFGLVSFALVFTVPYMGGLVPVGVALSSFFAGTLFALFIMGMFIPFVSAIGACCGLLAGVIVVGGLTVGSQLSADHGLIISEKLPVDISGCLARNFTIAENISSLSHVMNQEEAFDLFRISFLWYSLLATTVTLCVGIAVSAIPCARNKDLKKGSLERNNVYQPCPCQENILPEGKLLLDNLTRNHHQPTPLEDVEARVSESRAL